MYWKWIVDLSSLLGFILTIVTFFKVESLKNQLLSEEVKNKISNIISKIDSIKKSQPEGDADGDDLLISIKIKKEISILNDICNELITQLNSELKKRISLDKLIDIKIKERCKWNKLDQVLTDLRKSLYDIKMVLSDKKMK